MIVTGQSRANGKTKTPPPALRGGAARVSKHICFDIETGNPEEEAIQIVEQDLKPAGNCKTAEAQQKNLEGQRAKIREKAALLDNAPIACMAFVTERERVLFHHTGAPWGKYKVPKRLKGLADVELVCAKDERAMLADLRAWLEPRAVADRVEGQQDPSLLIGHNVKGFDLPHLRFAYVRQRLVAPPVLWPEARATGVEVFDTMKSFVYDYSNWYDVPFIGLDKVSALMGLPGYKQRISGADVPKYVAEGKFEEVAIYNVIDALQTYRIFLGLANLSGDQ